MYMSSGAFQNLGGDKEERHLKETITKVWI